MESPCDHPEFHMPPADSNRQLSEPQIELIKTWVRQGATWSRHWSLLPPQPQRPPAVKDQAWCRNPIDRFILGRLQQEGLTHSPQASKEALIRRVTLDLTGLPPTP